MTALYRPANGTEGMDFMGRWCSRCTGDANEDCPILAASFCGEVPQWRYEHGEPACTDFAAADPLEQPFMQTAAVRDLFPGARRSLTQGEQVRAVVLGSTGLVQ